MTEHQTPAGKIQPAITEHAGRSVDAAVRIDGHNDVAKTRQTLCQVTVAGVTRHGNKAGRTGAGKSVLNVDIKVFTRSRNPSTCGMVAMEQNQERVR